MEQVVYISLNKSLKEVLRRTEVSCRVTTHFEGVEAGDDSPILHLAAFGRMGELTFRVGSGTRASLELATHLQCQPFRVPDGRHIDRHFGLKAKNLKKKKKSRRYVGGEEEGASFCPVSFVHLKQKGNEI